MDKFVLAFTIVAISYNSEQAVLSTSSEIECGPNQLFNTCGAACPYYCHKSLAVPMKPSCTLRCVAGCQCAPGFVKEAIDSDNCISLEECKKTPRCGKNEIYYFCASACPRYCGSPVIVNCTKNCVQRCYCKPGYVYKSDHSSECIPINQC